MRSSGTSVAVLRRASPPRGGFHALPRVDCDHLRRRAPVCQRPRRRGAGRLLRPEQGPIPGLEVPRDENAALRRLLLPGGRGRRADGGPHGRTLVLAPLHALYASAQEPAAVDPVRQRIAVPPDECRGRGPRRGHRRRHGSVQTPYRPAVRRTDPGHRSRPGTRARARVPVRRDEHERQRRRRGTGRRALAPVMVHRGDGGVPVDRPRRSQYGDVDARGGPPRAPARDRPPR